MKRCSKKPFKNLGTPCKKSIILRYSSRFPEMQEWFKKTSIREGSRIFELTNYKGVKIFIKDETTLMHTGTYKALGACVSLAFCKKLGFEKIVFSSGANFGSAVSEYAKKHDIETFYFHPYSTIDKLNPLFFESSNAHVISVDKHEKEIKKLSREFAQAYNIQKIPSLDWRFIASSFRALEIAEYSEKHNKFDWIAQTVCAAYGPIGIYKEFENLAKEYAFEIPKFLGVQQDANCPIVNAWQDKQNKISPKHINANPEKYIEKALYNTNPCKGYPLLFEVLKKHKGDALLVGIPYYNKSLEFRNKFSENKLNFSTKLVGKKEEIIEKSGLLAFGGVLKAIDKGIIKSGESILCLMTGGCGPTIKKKLVSDCVVRNEKIEDAVKLLGAKFNLNQAPAWQQKLEKESMRRVFC